MNMYAEVNNDSPYPWNLVMIVFLFMGGKPQLKKFTNECNEHVGCGV